MVNEATGATTEGVTVEDDDEPPQPTRHNDISTDAVTKKTLFADI